MKTLTLLLTIISLLLSSCVSQRAWELDGKMLYDINGTGYKVTANFGDNFLLHKQ